MTTFPEHPAPIRLRSDSVLTLLGVNVQYLPEFVRVVRRHRDPSVDSDDLSFKCGEPRPDFGMRRTSLCLSIWMK